MSGDGDIKPFAIKLNNYRPSKRSSVDLGDSRHEFVEKLTIENANE